MRLISQNKEIDINYNNCVLKVNTIGIIAYSPNGMDYIMGKYDSHERAIEVLMDVRSEYQMKHKVFNFPKL